MSQDNNLPKIGAPVKRALQGIGIPELKQLTRVTEAELLQLHGFGPKTVKILRETLREKKLSFAGSASGKSEAKKKASPVSRTDKVDEFIRSLYHPLKKEVQVLRDTIRGVDKDI